MVHERLLYILLCITFDPFTTGDTLLCGWISEYAEYITLLHACNTEEIYSEVKASELGELFKKCFRETKLRYNKLHDCELFYRVVVLS